MKLEAELALRQRLRAEVHAEIEAGGGFNFQECDPQAVRVLQAEAERHGQTVSDFLISQAVRFRLEEQLQGGS